MDASVGMSRRTIIVVACVAVAFANSTYFGGRFFHASDVVYTACDAVIGGDKSVYISMIEEARQGGVLLHNLFTSESQRPRFIAPLWVLLGWMARFTHLSSVDMFEIARIVAGFFFVVWMGFLSNQLFRDRVWATIGFILVTFSSGLGAFFLPHANTFFIGEAIGRSLSPDLWHTEMNTFATIAHSALFIVSQAALLFIFLSWVKWESGVRRAIFFAIIVTFVLAIMHPYDAVIVVAVIGARLFFARLYGQRRFLYGALSIVIAATIPVLVHLWFFAQEIALAGWFAQNVTRVSSLGWYGIGYGLLLPLAVVALWRYRFLDPVFQFFLVWVGVVFISLFIPVQFQRRLINGAHIPLALLATYGLRIVFARARGRPMLVALGAWVLAIGLFGTTFYLIGEQVWSVAQPTSSLYLPKTTASVLGWIRENTARDAVVLAAPLNGNVIPAFSARRVYVGHGHQTIAYQEKRALLYRWFFARNDDDRVKEFFFRNEGIDYLLWTPLEQKLGIFDPEGKSYLHPVYRNDGAVVYAFIRQ